MFLLMFAAIGGGLAAASIVAPFGAGWAALAAPLGGSFCAALAAVYLTRHGAQTERSMPDLETQTDAMVTALRDAAARGAVADAVLEPRQASETDRTRAA